MAKKHSVIEHKIIVCEHIVKLIRLFSPVLRENTDRPHMFAP